ncbi:metC, partial [Symbiodinium microadriaticum]
HGAVIPPITTATSFVQPNLGQEGKFAYSRCGNPTRSAYESALADLEAGTWATATASGMAATALALELLEPGAHVLVMRGVYGGTFRLFETVRSRTMNLQFTYLDLNDLEDVRQQMRKETGMIWIESPTNPLLKLVDIPKLVEAVKDPRPARGLCKLFFDLLPSHLTRNEDNTFATAWNQQPLELGVDLVMLSASKYIGGHSDMTGGALVTKDPVLAQRLASLAKAVGGIASPFEAYLALRGMKTLAVRMERQCRNAQRVAEFLDGHPCVAEVHYPGLSRHPQHELCKRQMRSGGAVVTVRFKGRPGEEDLDMMRRFFSKIKFWILAESLGGVESMINHSATMSHGSMTKEQRASVGIYDTTLRLSVGVEVTVVEPCL